MLKQKRFKKIAWIESHHLQLQWKFKLLIWKFTWGNYLGKTLLSDVNKLFVFKSLLTMPSNVLPLHLKQTFPPIIWIFTEGKGDGIESRLLFKVFSTLSNHLINMYLNVRYRVNVASLVIVVEAVFVVCVTLDGDVGRGCCQSRGRGRVRRLWTPLTTRWQRMRLQSKQIKNSLKRSYQNLKKKKKKLRQNAATKLKKSKTGP